MKLKSLSFIKKITHYFFHLITKFKVHFYLSKKIG